MLLLLVACTSPLSASAKPAPEEVARTLAHAPADQDGIVYEIYVRSFQDTDGDGVGDLDGVRAHLPYLDWLGVDTLWLMPLFPGDGPAGYGVTDHTSIRDEYGGAEALFDLVDAAHDRNMLVILDLPINHVSVEHAWFRDANAGQGRERFVFGSSQWDEYRWFPMGDGSFYYAFFGADFPDLNWREESVRAEMEGMFTMWLEAGVDGFRLDAVSTLIETPTEITNTSDTHELLREIATLVHDVAPDALLLAEAGEANTSANMTYLGDETPEADLVLDFPRRDALLEAAESGSVERLVAVLAEEGEDARNVAPFLGSHDVSRLASVVRDPTMRKALMAANLTLPGRPVLYYGEELDIHDVLDTGGKDYAWRGPMPWDSTRNGGFTSGTPWMAADPGYMTGTNVDDELHSAESMLLFVNSLTTLRDENSALSAGSFEIVESQGGVLTFHRENGADTLDVTLQFSGKVGCSVVSRSASGERVVGC